MVMCTHNLDEDEFAVETFILFYTNFKALQEHLVTIILSNFPKMQLMHSPPITVFDLLHLLPPIHCPLYHFPPLLFLLNSVKLSLPPNIYFLVQFCAFFVPLHLYMQTTHFIIKLHNFF